MAERRQYTRITFYRDVVLSHSDGETSRSRSYDFSMYGMGIYTKKALTSGEMLNLEFMILGADEQRNINLRGEVVYSRPSNDESGEDKFRTGIHFC